MTIEDLENLLSNYPPETEIGIICEVEHDYVGNCNQMYSQLEDVEFGILNISKQIKNGDIKKVWIRTER